MMIATPWRHAVPLLVGGLLLVGCSKEVPASSEKLVTANVPGAPPGADADAAAKDARSSDVRQKDDLIEFSYAYPREAARIPEVAAWLDNDRATKRDALVAAAKGDKAAAERGGFPYRTNSHLQTWKVVTDTPRFLSLSADIATYAGGAHGMTSFDTLIWDRNHRKLLKPLDLFVGGEAFDAAIREPFCTGIKRAKAAKGIVAEGTSGGPFAKCPPASAQTIWLGSSDGRHLDRLTIAIAPYEIGPFAEGSYKINVPVDGALSQAAKAEFARDFRSASQK
ncbi:MAG: DUF4163 domain-containing protein [Sphingopyxis sp.]|nr:DUF4163 domain-containing protein [Sphingopyxis sp.]